MLILFMVEYLKTGVEVKKVDSQGCLILPVDWREAEIGENREVYVVKRKCYLKLVPRRLIDLTQYFDKVDLDVDSIGNWATFEKRIHKRSPMKFLEIREIFSFDEHFNQIDGITEFLAYNR